MSNYFELRLCECEPYAGKIGLDASVWIDGELLDQPHYISLPELVHSTHAPGNYEIFVCGCGRAGCAGAADVRVVHDGNLIRWAWDLPVCDWSDDADPDAPFPTKPITFVFERGQMLEALESFVAAARDLIGTNPSKYDWPVFGFAAVDLIALDPSKPYFSPRLRTPWPPSR